MDFKHITSESVSCGHPDKVADQIADAILDALLIQDTEAKVACEVLVKTGLVFVSGEISTKAYVDIEQLVRQTLREIGYVYPELGFSAEACSVIVSIGPQSKDIRCGVNRKLLHLQGAGDQGTMIGFASDETDCFMPAAILYAHRLMKRQYDLRTQGVLTWLRPDAKAQITLLYKDNCPIKVTSCVLSTQHSEEIDHVTLQELVKKHLILPVLPEAWIDESTEFFINPTGRFVVGGPQSDAGLTGRKLMVDTYGTYARHGGGSFSGKDPSKVDRSAAYMARYLAKNLVAAGICKRCEVQLSYAIGVANPVAVYVETFNTGCVSSRQLEEWIKSFFDLTPHGIIKKLNLLQPRYRSTAVYGHFGRPEFSWEQTDSCESIVHHFGSTPKNFQ